MRNKFDYKDGQLAFAAAVAVFVAAQLILGLLISLVSFGSFWYWLLMAMSSILIGIVPIVYCKLSKVSFAAATTVNKAPSLAHAGWGIIAVVGLIAFMVPVNEWICDLIEATGLKRPSVDLPMQIAPLVIVASVIPAVTEELMFRGVIGNAFSHGTNPVKGIALSGALFALFHMNPAQTLHQFVLGAFLTLLVLRSGSVWTASIVHLFNNVTAVILSFFVEETGFFERNAVWLCIVGAAVFAGSIAGYLFTTKSCRSGVYCEETSGSDGDSDNYKRIGSAAAFYAAIAVCAVLWITSLFS